MPHNGTLRRRCSADMIVIPVRVKGISIIASMALDLRHRSSKDQGGRSFQERSTGISEFQTRMLVRHVLFVSHSHSVFGRHAHFFATEPKSKPAIQASPSSFVPFPRSGSVDCTVLWHWPEIMSMVLFATQSQSNDFYLTACCTSGDS